MLVCPWSSKVRVCLCTVHPWLLRHVIFSSHKSTVHFQNLHSKIQPNGQLFSGWLHLFRLGLHTFICGYLQWMQFWQIKTPINTKLITILHHELYAQMKLFFQRIYFFPFYPQIDWEPNAPLRSSFSWALHGMCATNISSVVIMR